MQKNYLAGVVQAITLMFCVTVVWSDYIASEELYLISVLVFRNRQV